MLDIAGRCWILVGDVGQSLTSLKNVGNYWMMLGDVNGVPRVTPVGEAKKDVAKGRRGKSV